MEEGAADNLPEPCRRCGEGVLEVDIDGLVICQSCGYVAEDNELQNQQWSTQPGSRAGPAGAANVNEHGHAGAGYRVESSAFTRGVGMGMDKEEGAAYRLRQLVDQLEGMGSALRLPATVIQDAGNILREYKGQVAAARSIHALLGGSLYLAARRAGLGVIIPEVAAAAGVQAKAVGSMYREVATSLGFSLPAANLRSLVLRHASEIIARYYQPSGADAAQPGQGGGAILGPEEPAGPGPGPGAEAGQVSLRDHLFMRNALQLAELVAKLDARSGMNISTLAAGILRMVADAFPPEAAVARSLRQQLHTIVGVQRSQVTLSKKEIQALLLDLARVLPFGASIAAENLLQYLPTLCMLSATIVTLKSKEAATKPEQVAAVGVQPQPREGPPTAAAPSARQQRPQTAGAGGPRSGQCSPITEQRIDGAAASSLAGEAQVDGKDPVVDSRRKRQRVGCGHSGKQEAGREEPGTSQLGAAPPLLLHDAPLWQPAEGEEDDARVALGLMTMEELRLERSQRGTGGEASPG